MELEKRSSAEWLLSGSICLLLGSLLAISKIQGAQLPANALQEVVMVEAVVNGCVASPGTYKVAVGAPLEEVLRKARPKRFADLRALDLQAPVNGPIRLEIAERDSIEVHVMGAVEHPATIEVPAGTRICSLKNLVPLSPESDLSFFKKRRLIEDGETVVVPNKMEKK